jgi:uncharacterized protein
MPGIGTSYTPRDPQLMARVLPLVDYVELVPDNIATMRNGAPAFDADAIEHVRDISSRTGVIAHGVGLSIGSIDRWNDAYLGLLDALFDTVPISWHSEHLGYTMAGGAGLGTMLTLPRVEEALDVICPRVAAIQARYAVPFLLEHVVSLLPEHPESDYSPAGFLNEIVRRTGCGLLLDLYNLECDAHNGQLDVEAFLDELDLDAVREIHVANGVERRGVMLDIHSRGTRPETQLLLDRVLERASHVDAVVFEFVPEAVPTLGLDAIERELEVLRGKVA